MGAYVIDGHYVMTLYGHYIIAWNMAGYLHFAIFTLEWHIRIVTNASTVLYRWRIPWLIIHMKWSNNSICKHIGRVIPGYFRWHYLLHLMINGNNACNHPLQLIPNTLDTLKTLYVPFFLQNHKCVFTFSIIPPCRYDTGVWNLFSWKTRSYLFYIVNIMVADDLSTQGRRASATMLLTSLNRNNSVPAL